MSTSRGARAGGAARPQPAAARRTPKQVSRERSIEGILQSALQLFVQQGYSETTIDEIADHCALTKGAVYYYFESKEALLVRLLEQFDEAVDLPEDLLSTDEPATARLVRFVHNQGRDALNRPDGVLLLVMLLNRLNLIGDEPRKRVQRIFDRFSSTFREIVRSGVRSGEFTLSVPTSELSLFYRAVYTGNVMQWHLSGRQARVGKALVRALRLSVLSVLGVPPPSRVRRVPAKE